jgi:predicted NBD/HSP70 family sugar kinase
MTISRDLRARNRGVAAEELRRHNLGTLLETLHLSGPVTRSGLTALTGLNRSTIADLIGELMALDLAEERQTVNAGPGRPSPLVVARPHGAVVLAVDIEVDSIAVATIGLEGHIFNRLRVSRPRGRFAPHETIKDLATLARPLLDSLPAGHRMVGVGVAIVGLIRRADGFLHLAPNLGWHDLALGEMIRAEFDVPGPIKIANEADLGALGEHRRGAATRAHHLIYISGEVGIGAGIIVDGKPLLGANGYAGEAGHTLIHPGGRKCRCGAAGCWETEAGEAALLRKAGIRGVDDPMKAADMIAAAARAGDEVTLAAIEEVGTWLGLGLANLIDLFNPEVIILGGMYHQLFEFLGEVVTASARARALAAPGSIVKIVKSKLGAGAPLIGAAEMVLSDVMADPARLRTQGRSSA